MKINGISGKRALPLIFAVALGLLAPDRLPAADRFSGAKRLSDSMPRLYSLQLIQDGKLVFEHYRKGDRNRPTDIKSASKVLLSALVGIARTAQKFPPLSESIWQTMPGLFPEDASAKRKRISWEDLLTMRSGLQSTSRGRYGAWVSHDHWARAALGMPLTGVPGETFAYSTGDSHLLATGLRQLVQTDLKAYAETRIFDRIGGSIISWQRSPEGVRFGGNSLVVSPLTMRRLAMLFLQQGKWQGQTIIPADWVKRSLQQHVKRKRPFIQLDATGYGYYWWRITIAGRSWSCALGYGGQHICLQPQDRHAIITTSDPTPGDMDDHYAKMARLFAISARGMLKADSARP